MKYIALRTDDGKNTGKIALYCRVLHVKRQAFYKYLSNKDKPWKYQWVVDLMNEIIAEYKCNDTYGRKRMYQALKIKVPNDPKLPCENTIHKIMEKIGLIHKPKRKPTEKPVSPTIFLNVTLGQPSR